MSRKRLKHFLPSHRTTHVFLNTHDEMCEGTSFSPNGAGINVSLDEKKVHLEQRYIELLERRVAALEDCFKVKSSQDEVINQTFNSRRLTS